MIYDDDDDLVGAVIAFREAHQWCEVCDKCVKFDTCDHPKNGYCALFRLQSAKDMLEIKNKSK